MSTKVTILLATYNRAHLIEETLRSIQNQTYSNFECIVTDDNSRDNTAAIVKGFCGKDRRFSYLKKPQEYSSGLSANRNFGLDNAQGSFIVFCDDDDVMHPQHLQICVNILQTQKVDFVHFKKQSFTLRIPAAKDISVCDLHIKNINDTQIYEVITQTIGLASCTVMWKKKIIAQQRFNANLDYAEEWEFYSRLILNGAKGIQINKTLYYARKHSQSNTGEFYAGNPKRLKSKIEASKLIISNLNEKNLLSPQLIDFFCWESVRLKNSQLLHHLIQQSQLSTFHKFRARMKFKMGPLTQFLMRLKKKVQ